MIPDKCPACNKSNFYRTGSITDGEVMGIDDLVYTCSAPILFFCRIFEFLKSMERALGISFSVLDVVLFAVSAFSSVTIFVEPVFENV